MLVVFGAFSDVSSASIGYNVSGLAIQIACLCTFGIIWIYVRLFRSIREDHFTLYLGFCLFSAFALFAAAVQRLLPSAPASAGARGYQISLEVFLGVVISMQWLVQSGALFFLMIRNPGDKWSIRRVFVASVITAFCLLIPWTVSIALGKAFVGEVINETLLMVLFGAALFSTTKECGSCCPERMRSARPMLRVWAGFMAAAHTLFLIMYAVRAGLPGSEGW